MSRSQDADDLSDFREVIGALKADLAAARDEIGRLQAERVSRGQTLSEFFALADRVGDAARVIREAQAMMGGAPGRELLYQRTTVTPEQVAASTARGDEFISSRAPVPAIYGRGSEPLTSGPTSNKGPVIFTPEELAQKEMMRMERDRALEAALPESIKAAMREAAE